MDQVIKIENAGSPEEEMRIEINQHLFALEKVFLKYDQRPMGLTLIADRLLPDNKRVLYLFSGRPLIDVIEVLNGTMGLIKKGEGN